MVAKIDSSEIACGKVENEFVPEGRTARAWGGNSEAGPISPIGTFALSFWGWEGVPESRSSPHICPGTQLVFSTPERVQNIGVHLQLNQFHIADYRENYEFGYIWR